MSDVGGSFIYIFYRVLLHLIHVNLYFSYYTMYSLAVHIHGRAFYFLWVAPRVDGLLQSTKPTCMILVHNVKSSYLLTSLFVWRSVQIHVYIDFLNISLPSNFTLDLSLLLIILTFCH